MELSKLIDLLMMCESCTLYRWLDGESLALAKIGETVPNENARIKRQVGEAKHIADHWEQLTKTPDDLDELLHIVSNGQLRFVKLNKNGKNIKGDRPYLVLLPLEDKNA